MFNNRYLITPLFVFITLFFPPVTSFASHLFAFGDSHVRELTGTQNLTINYLGPVTMHRIGREQLNILDLKRYGVVDGDVAIFVFGEIDIRCHVGKQHSLQQRTLNEILQTLADNYIAAIVKNRLQFHHLTCVVYSITPPSDSVYNPEYPRIGSLEERVRHTKQLNALLDAACSIHNIKFLDVYDDFSDADGALLEELSDGNVHVNHEYNAPIVKKLFNLLSNKNTLE